METTTVQPKVSTGTQTDFLPLHGTDYVEFYVGNAKQAAHFYKTAFGFQSLAYSGPETGVKDRVSYAIRQNKLTFVLTTPLKTDNPIADHVYKHGDGARIAAFCITVPMTDLRPTCRFPGIRMDMMGFSIVFSARR